MIEWLLYPLVVFIGWFTDFCFAKYTQHTAQYNPFYAANWGTLVFIGGITYVYYVAEGQWMLLVCYMVGSYIGSYQGAKKRNEDGSKNSEN